MVVNFISEEDYESVNVSNPLFADLSVQNYIKEISKYPSIEIEEEIELARKAKEGSIESKQKLINANLKLVVTIARKIIHTSKLPMIDLIQEGNVGLMVAADKFNWKFGYRFSTYASWWIKQAMFKAISEQSHCVKIPVYIQETLSKYKKIKSEMEKENNCEVSSKEVAKKMNIESEKIENYLGAYKQTLSLEADYEINNGSEVKLIDIIEDKNSSVSRDIEYNAFKRDIKMIINTLKEREQKVIMLRFGLEENNKQTLEEIGKLYGVTKECIRQTEMRALKKLRIAENCEKLYETYLK